MMNITIQARSYSSLITPRSSFLILLAVLTMLSAGASVAGQGRDPFEGRRRAAARSNPPGVVFNIKLKGGQTRFHAGEVIGLEMAFSSSLPGAYRLDDAGYDRSGRLDIDDFHLDPEDGDTDPLDEYFNSGIFGYIGGGIRGFPDLTEKPHVVAVELNEWFRFDRPGRYRLYVTTDRVAPKRRRDEQAETPPVTSNAVEFEILPPDPAWSKRALAGAVSVLDSKEARADRRAACRTLRFLGTEAATRELARRLRGDESNSGCDYEFDFGLLSTPYRALAVSEMERLLGEPGHPVTAQFLRTLSFLSLLQQGSFAPLPPYVPGDEARAELLSKEFERRRNAYQATLEGYSRRLALAVFAKEGKARAVSLDALLRMRERPPRGEAGQDEKLLKDSLAAVFTELTQEQQGAVLEFQWDLVAGPSMLPALRRIYESPPNGYDRLPDLALRRLYDLAPDEGRRFILEELRRAGGPKVSAHVLGILPDETLPEADALVAASLGQPGEGAERLDDEQLLPLAERYATVASAPLLRSHYEARVGRMACTPQTALLAYFLRAEPMGGAALLEKALASRKDTGCYHSLLADVAALYVSPELERAAVASLDDADPTLASDAAQMLGRHGSAAARDALLARFARWREEWAGREKELLAQQERDAWASQSRVETSLLNALAYSPAWLADAELLERLRGLCVTKSCAEAADSALKQFGPSVTAYFNRMDGRVSTVSLSQYSSLTWEQAKRKVAQFPKGTTFKWHSDSPDSEWDERAFEEFRAHLEKLGMKLTR